jgi:tRNA A-37 threonylcarbamoyl transferase component Bud32
MSTLIGKTVGKVRIGEMIARGGMAEVYLGEHTTLNRKVAVKIIREHVDTDPDIRARFEREARVMAGLRHPNIIQVFDFDITEGQPLLIMEYIPGASLGNYLKALHKRGEKLPFSTVSRLITSLAAAIDYAHSHHLIHRDIKPANVLLRSASGVVDSEHPLPEDVEPILTDFGLVRLLDSSIQTSTGTVSGTPTYMSPEQARGEKVDLKTDIYSLGVMLYEMLAGEVPFEAESSIGILMKHLNEPPPAIAGISTDLQAIIDRALAKDSTLRYDSATQLAHDFNSVFNGQTLSLDTVRLAKIARQSVFDKGRQSQLFKLDRTLTVVGIFIVIGFAFLAVRWFSPATIPIKQVGQFTFSDFAGKMDKVTLEVTDLPKPEAGTHYEAWALAQGGEQRNKIGAVEMGDTRQGILEFTAPDGGNILGIYDQFEITIEPDNDPQPDQPSADVVGSSVFPPLALIHVRHLTYAFQAAPNGRALIQGLLTTAQGVSTSTQELQNAFKNGDEALTRKKIEEVINQIVGKTNTNDYSKTGAANTTTYKDWNSDGAIDDPGDGYGLLGGYIPQSISHAQYAAQSIDATENIQSKKDFVVISAQNMDGWSKQLLEKALELQGKTFDAGMEPVITEMLTLSGQIVNGTDSNKNGVIEPIVGEAGAKTAYENAYNMAIMPLLPGAHQIPVPALPNKTQ